MASDPHYMSAVPEESIPISGPTFRLGCAGWAAFALLSLVAIPFGAAIITGSTETPVILVFVPIVIIWVIIFVMVLKSFGTSAPRPTGIDVLRDILNFDLDNLNGGVGITAFCRPDTVQAGAPSALLIFMQNYRTRPKHIKMKLGSSELLGNLSGEVMHFKLSPGQCAVYRHIIRIPPGTEPGEYPIRCGFTVKSPEKDGVRLIKRSKKERTIVLTRSRVLVFSIDVREGGAGAVQADTDYQDAPVAAALTPPPLPGFGVEARLPDPSFHSLYYPELKEPRFDILEQISNAAPTEAIVFQ